MLYSGGRARASCARGGLCAEKPVGRLLTVKFTEVVLVVDGIARVQVFFVP